MQAPVRRLNDWVRMLLSYTRWSASLQIADCNSMDVLRSCACCLLCLQLTMTPNMLAQSHAWSMHCERMLRMLIYSDALAKLFFGSSASLTSR
jgi:hypothetical protein